MAQEELVALQSKLHDITLPDFSGDVKIKYIGNAHYEFHRWGSEVTGQGPRGSGEEGWESPRIGLGHLWGRRWDGSSQNSEGSSGRNLGPFIHSYNKY